MNDSVKKSKKQKEIIGQLIMLFITFAISMCVTFVLPKFHKNDLAHEGVVIDSGWDATISGTEYKNITISETRFPMLNKHDVMTLENRLADKLPNHPMLVLYSIHSIVKVSVDDNVIFEYGEDLAEKGDIVGYGYHYIALDEADAGKKISVLYNVTENEAFSSLPVPYIGNSDYVIRDFIISNRVNLIVLGICFVLGIILTGVSLFYMRKNRSMFRLLAVGLFSISISGWSICNKDLFMIFSYNLYLKTFLEFGLLYLAPLFLFMYFDDEIKYESKKRLIVYRTLLIIQAVFSVGSWILQLTGLVHFPVMLKYCHVILAVLIVFMISRFCVDIFRGLMEVSPLVYGFEFLFFFVVYDLVWFNIGKFVASTDNDHYSGVLYVGVLFLVLSMVVDIAVQYIRGIQQSVEKAVLEKLANTDPLTGIANRRSFDDGLDSVVNEKKSYAVVSFDLNDLKKINDSFGHDEGDLYLKEFAKALIGSFGEIALVARTGGDEFASLITDWNGEELTPYIDKLKVLIEGVNSEHKNWSMSSAFGYATSEEPDVTSVREAIKLADERMYQCKKQMKKETV